MTLEQFLTIKSPQLQPVKYKGVELSIVFLSIAEGIVGIAKSTRHQKLYARYENVELL